MSKPPIERRIKQRRKGRTSKCRRCKGTGLVPTGEPVETIIGGEVGLPVKPCDCRIGPKDA